MATPPVRTERVGASHSSRTLGVARTSGQEPASLATPVVSSIFLQKQYLVRIYNHPSLRSQFSTLSHDTATPVPALPKPFGPCKFFAQGRCNKTDCPFPHMQLETNGTRTQSPHTATPVCDRAKLSSSKMETKSFTGSLYHDLDSRIGPGIMQVLPERKMYATSLPISP